MFKAGLALTLGKNWPMHSFSLVISMLAFLLKLEKRKLQSILARFMKKILSILLSKENGKKMADLERVMNTDLKIRTG